MSHKSSAVGNAVKHIPAHRGTKHLVRTNFHLHCSISAVVSARYSARSLHGIRGFAVVGALAQLVERNTGSVEVSGSTPLRSTTSQFDCCISFITENGSDISAVPNPFLESNGIC